jgi:hypothetical protein
MSMSVSSVIPALLLLLVSDPSSVRQERVEDAEGSAATPGAVQKRDLRKRTRFRILDKEGKPWLGAKVVAYSRPCEGMMDRVESSSGKRGRATAMLLPGRSYAAWAWSPVENGVVGEYRISILNRSVGAGGIISLREAQKTKIRIHIDLEGATQWKAPLKGVLAGTLDSYSRSYLSLDVLIEGNKISLPVCPIASATLYILDADGHLVGSSHFATGRQAQEKALKVADKRRENRKKAAEAVRKREADKKAEAQKKTDALNKAKHQAATGKSGEDQKPAAPETAMAQKEQENQAEKEALAKAKALKAAAKAKLKVKAQQFQVVKLGPLIQGINVVHTAGASNVTVDYVALGKVKWKVYPPYHYKLKLEDKKTKAPIANARIFQGLNGMSYELGKSDARGIAVITVAAKLNAKTLRPTLRNTNFRVQAKGYPETYVQRNNLKFPPALARAKVEAEATKPIIVSKLVKGFSVKGRVLLAEGQPLARTSLIVMTGMVYDYGNRNTGFNQSGLPYRIETDEDGRFEWPCCDSRFMLSINAILGPETMASVAADERFPDSARVILYHGKGKGAQQGGVIIGGGQILIGGLGQEPILKDKEEKKDDKKKDKGKDGKEKKPEKPTEKDIGDIRLDKLATVRVQVFQTDGTPTPHARVGLASLKGRQNYLSPPLHLCNHLGRLRIRMPAGDDYILGAGIRGQALLSKLVLPAKEPIMVRLTSGLILKGRIVDPNGEPLAGANVYLNSYGRTKVLHQGLWNALRGGNTTALSKADGSFEIPILPETSYRFQVNYRKGNQWYNIGQQQVETETSSQDLGDLEIPVPVLKKNKKKDKAESSPSK